MNADRPAGGGHGPRRSAFGFALVLLAILTAPITVPVLAMATFLVCNDVSLNRFYARTPLVAALGGSSMQDQQTQFAERIQHAFPVGTRVDQVKRTLTDQGFTPLPYHDGFDAAYRAEHSSFPCRLDWDVFWSAQDEVVSAVRGVMEPTCL